MRSDVTPKAPPAHCRHGCGLPIGQKHREDCRASGWVEPDDVVQMGGLPPVLLSGEDLQAAKLALFVYRVIRDSNAGAAERAALEAEGAMTTTFMEVSNRLLFAYAENIANRMLPGYPPPPEVLAQPTDVESLLTRLMEAESTPSQGEATVQFLKGEIHEAIKEAQILGIRLAQAQVAADDQETIKAFPTEFELRAATTWMLLKQLNSTAIEGIEDAAPGLFAAVVQALRGEDPTEGDLDDFVATRLAALKRYRDETNG